MSPGTFAGERAAGGFTIFPALLGVSLPMLSISRGDPSGERGGEKGVRGAMG